MENEIEKPRWWAQALFIGAIVSAVLMVMAGFGTRLGMWSYTGCLLYTSPSPRDVEESRMPSSA